LRREVVQVIVLWN